MPLDFSFEDFEREAATSARLWQTRHGSAQLGLAETGPNASVPLIIDAPEPSLSVPAYRCVTTLHRLVPQSDPGGQEVAEGRVVQNAPLAKLSPPRLPPVIARPRLFRVLESQLGPFRADWVSVPPARARRL